EMVARNAGFKPVPDMGPVLLHRLGAFIGQHAYPYRRRIFRVRKGWLKQQTRSHQQGPKPEKQAK
ncbi:hypothetical protein, partial [Thiobacillus denitrificans]|uniref:hypothetical protein n=1 Tax=Thiobacillus denitrificans TaxID=36861 RepID=UPI00138F198C